MFSPKLNVNLLFIICVTAYFFLNILFKNRFFDFFFLITFLFVSLFKVKKKFKINFDKIIIALPLFILFIISLINYTQIGILIDLKISYYLLLIIISYIFFDLQKKDLEFFLLVLIYGSFFLILYGLYGWFNGGENINDWGINYFYFGYTYLPSTRNEDSFIFLIGYLLTLYFLFFEKKNKKMIFLINQLNLIAIILSFSRGAYLSLIITLFAFLIINRNKIQLASFIKYFFSSILISVFLFNISNQVTKIDLGLVFKTKVGSVFKFINKYDVRTTNLKFSELDDFYDLNFNNKKYKSLEKTSLYSLQLKINDWKKILDTSESNRYYENGFIYLYKNYGLFSIILSIFFFSLLYFNFLKKKNKKNFIENLNLNILILFLFLNIIYNFLDDYINYLIILFLLASTKIETNLLNKVKSLLFEKK